MELKLRYKDGSAAFLAALGLGLVLFLGISASSPSSPQKPPGGQQTLPERDLPRNVILMIGNGMGLSQISAGLYHNRQRLNLVKFPQVGIHKPSSYNNLISDAAAGSTAFSTGVKTYSGALGVDPDTQRVRNLFEECDLKGLKRGLVTTSRLVDPTPAAFFAHQAFAEQTEDVAADLVLSSPNIFIGGGKKFFTQRADNRNLLKLLEKKNFHLEDRTDNWKNFSLPEDLDPKKKVGIFTAADLPGKASEGRKYLLHATRLALEFLQARSENGFFLLIEGAQIEQGGQENDPDYIISEVLDFDRAIGEVLDFAETNGNTLVIVTSDHETGGFALNVGSTATDLIGSFTTTGKTGTMIPVFTYGPGSALFSGIFENTAIHHKIREALQLDVKSVILD